MFPDRKVDNSPTSHTIISLHLHNFQLDIILQSNSQERLGYFGLRDARVINLCTKQLYWTSSSEVLRSTTFMHLPQRVSKLGNMLYIHLG